MNRTPTKIWQRGYYEHVIRNEKALNKIREYIMNNPDKEKYDWEYEGKKYLAIHGHQFDRFLVDNAIISSLATGLYNFIQRIDFEDKKISHFLKKTSKGWLRLSEKVSDSAILYGKERRADYVFCGHTHKAMHKIVNSINYYNGGCWTDTPCAYITVDGENIDINYY